MHPLSTSGGLLLPSAILIAFHTLMYLAAALGFGLFAFGFTGLMALGAAQEGEAAGWVATGVFGSATGVMVIFLLAFALVHAVLTVVTFWASVRGLLGRGSREGLMAVAALSTLVCGGWAMLSLVALNPMFLGWAICGGLSLVAGILLLTAPPAPAGY